MVIVSAFERTFPEVQMPGGTLSTGKITFTTSPTTIIETGPVSGQNFTNFLPTYHQLPGKANIQMPKNYSVVEKFL